MKSKGINLVRILWILVVSLLPYTEGVNAQTWQYLGAQYSVNEAADLSVGYSGSTRTMYLAAPGEADNGVLRSTGTPIGWTKKSFPSPVFVVCVSSSPSTVYAGKSGLLQKSTTSGDAWTTIHTGLSNTVVRRLAISPFNANNLYVGCKAVQQGGEQAATPVLFRSTDAGLSWSSVPEFILNNAEIWRIIFDPSDQNYQYVGGRDADGGVYRWDGTIWLSKRSGMGTDYNVKALAITPQSGSTNILYAGTNTTSQAHIYKTTNRGDTWTISYTPAAGVIINDMKVDPFSPTLVYAATSAGVLKSTNSGSTWSSVSAGLGDLDVRTVAIDPNTANLVYIGTATKFYYSTNGGSTWIDAGADIVKAGGMAIYNDDVYVMNAEKNALLMSKLAAGSSTWEVLSAQSTSQFQAKDLAIDYSDPNKLYAAGQKGDQVTILKSADGGRIWNVGHQHGGGNGEALNAIAIDPNLSSHVIGAAHWIRSGQLVEELWYSTDYGVTWNNPSSYYSADYYAIAYHKSTGSPGSATPVVYAGGWQLLTGQGRTANAVIVKSTNGGDTWQLIFYPGGLNRWVSSFAMDPVNSNVIYAATGVGFSGSGTIYKTTDGGTHWNELTNLPLTGNRHEIVSLLHHPKHSNVLYLAEQADIGVWTVSVTHDGGTTRSALSTGLPSDVGIYHLAFKSNLPSGECPQYLYAATASGVYKIDLNIPASASTVSAWNFISPPLLACDMSKTSVWTAATTSAYNYVGGYVAQPQLVNGFGYWVKFNQATNISYEGASISKKAVTVKEGWNIIGGLTDPVTTNTITSTPAGIILTHFWGFDASTGHYTNADDGTIDPGKAYWVKVSQDGLLTLDATATQSNPASPSPEMPPAPPSAPAPPTLLSPANGATGVSTLPTLSWIASEDATSYRVQISASPGFSPLTYEYPGLPGTSKQTGALEGNTTYYWQVNATNNFGTSGWSTARSFTTGPAPVPAAPTLVSPANFATNQSTTPLLRWNTSTYATSYRVQLSSDMGFSTFVVNDPVTGTSKYVSGLNNNTTYYWRVYAKNNGGTSGWSLTWAFTTRASVSCTCCPTIDPAPDAFRVFGGLIDTINSVWNSQNLLAQLGVPSIPMPPDDGGFDARFASGNYLEGIPPDLLPIDIPIVVRGATYPITFSWNKTPGSDIIYTLLSPVPMTLVDSGTVTISELVDGIIRLTARQSPSSGCGRTVERAPAGENSEKPVNFALHQNAPNPFNPSTIIKYDLPEASHVTLTIYNTLGQEVATPVDAVIEGGYMSAVVDASSFPSGVYFYRLQAQPMNGGSSFVDIKKFVLIK